MKKIQSLHRGSGKKRYKETAMKNDMKNGIKPT